MDKWIQHYNQSTIDKIDYVLVSYYEDKCNYRVLNEKEINEDIFGKLRAVFKNQFLGMGEFGYSAGDGGSSKTCSNDPNCYCSTSRTHCDEAKTGRKSICRKSKISQMQRYYSMKPADKLFIGGGFWWNMQDDYQLAPEFLAALIRQFNCLSKNLPCEVTPVDCR